MLLKWVLKNHAGRYVVSVYAGSLSIDVAHGGTWTRLTEMLEVETAYKFMSTPPIERYHCCSTHTGNGNVDVSLKYLHRFVCRGTRGGSSREPGGSRPLPGGRGVCAGLAEQSAKGSDPGAGALPQQDPALGPPVQPHRYRKPR